MEMYEYYYELGRLCFEIEDYDNAVSLMIQSYELSENNRDMILSNIYNCFVVPNNEEFEENLKMNQLELKDCSLDFIPVSDTKFYIYDTERKQFGKSFDIEKIYSNDKENDYRSIFIAKTSDVASVINNLSCKNWKNIYMLNDDADTQLNSLYKLPGWSEYVDNNVTLFNSKEELKKYFVDNSEKYLPRIVVSDNIEYNKLFENIHQLRLREKKKNDPILSICIPTYNRGDKALDGVKRVLESKLDSEIEVVVSNNGSTIGEDKYNEIEQIKDSRLNYFRFESNQGYFDNIINCLKMAKGKFAVIVSDEDYINIEYLNEYINVLCSNRDMGAFIYGGEFQIKEKGIDAIMWGATNNYVSGITFNMEYLRKCDCINVMVNNKDNYFCEAYVHCAILIILGNKYNLCQTNVPIIIKGEESDYSSAVESEENILVYTIYDNRVKLLDAFSEFAYNEMFERQLQCKMMLGYTQVVYGMLCMAYQTYGERFNYFNICCSLFKHINDKRNENHAAYELLNGESIESILLSLFVDYCTHGIKQEKIPYFIEKMSVHAKEYDKISGYDYENVVYDIFERS